MSAVSNGPWKVLFIGRPVLNAQWDDQSDFYTRRITFQEYLRNHNCQVHTYPVPPIFDAQAARQLLSSFDYIVLILNVSFLELDHHQCTSILDGITILLNNQPAQVRVIILRIEYEMGNPEHRDAVQQAGVVARSNRCGFLGVPNHHIEAFSKMEVNGDDGTPIEDD